MRQVEYSLVDLYRIRHGAVNICTECYHSNVAGELEIDIFVVVGLGLLMQSRMPRTCYAALIYASI